jgi:serine/threonine protein kinase
VIIRKLLLGLSHMRAKGVIHRDLKPENVCPRYNLVYNDNDNDMDSQVLLTIDEKRNISTKICDFKMCRIVADPTQGHLSDFCGSPGFFAPEVLLHRSYWCVYPPFPLCPLLLTTALSGFKADIFSIGVICLELLSAPVRPDLT